MRGMQSEVSRQLVHLSGLVFIFLAQVTGALIIATYSFMIACTFLLYSELIVRQQKQVNNLLLRFESKLTKLRSKAMSMERSGVRRPFTGAFWFYFAFGLTFAIFPLTIASAACAMLAVGDSLSTLAGRAIGRHRIIGKKTVEGSMVFLISSFLIALIFINPLLALIASITAMLVELLPELSLFRKRRSIIDDNLLIPLITALFLLILISI